MIPTRYSQLCSWLPLVLALLGAACSGAHEPTQGTAPAPPRPPIAPTANVPALVGATISELRTRLGPPGRPPRGFHDPSAITGTSRPGSEPLDSVAAFRVGGLPLLASYDARSGRVHDLLLLGPHEDVLMGQASLQANAAAYLVLPVFRPEQPGRLLGLRVVPTR